MISVVGDGKAVKFTCGEPGCKRELTVWRNVYDPALGPLTGGRAEPRQIAIERGWRPEVPHGARCQEHNR